VVKPCDVGTSEVSRLMCDGVVHGELAMWFSNRTPSRARASMWGVTLRRW
jgi:hypothetical protein